MVKVVSDSFFGGDCYNVWLSGGDDDDFSVLSCGIEEKVHCQCCGMFDKSFHLAFELLPLSARKCLKTSSTQAGWWIDNRPLLSHQTVLSICQLSSLESDSRIKVFLPNEKSKKRERNYHFRCERQINEVKEILLNHFLWLWMSGWRRWDVCDKKCHKFHPKDVIMFRNLIIHRNR